MNLLSNAIEALEAKTDSLEIVIQTEHVANSIAIKISDNGIGIPAEIQAKIFDPFLPLNPSAKASA